MREGVNINIQTPLKSKILIFPCGGSSDVGQLTVHAAQELILEGKAEWVSVGRIKDLPETAHETTSTPPFIVVDGCEKQCGRRYLEKLKCDIEFHLSLADLGIWNPQSPRIPQRADIGDEDLQLVKDAIIAESTRLSARPPMILGGCCCR
jgi:uncharacterized metal-binding protein